MLSCDVPVLVGSGVTHDNLHQYMDSSGIIIGSYLKESGHWNSPLSEQRTQKFMKKVNSLRN